ncbi:acetylornithine deacetylase [Enterococcus lemanii]|uniref:Acetylornithine deacetylase n=1 Tax=Enterococcus lemanii TaxID=1159752 RepID=A0ABV9MTM1_9ENTE|nr:acetylornithine deacetylase [Enterococcus lemanii]
MLENQKSHSAEQMKIIEKVWAEMENNQELLIEIMRTLVQFETVSPPARNTIAAQEWVALFLQECGFITESIPFYKGDCLLVGKRKGKNNLAYHNLILNGHMDVATIGDRANWQTSPFHLTFNEGRLYGRGTSDMKAAIASNLWLFKIFHEMGIQLNGEVQFQSVVGEEAGEAGTRTLLENGYKADFAIVNDTTNLAIQGQGGCVTGWITVKSPAVYHDGNRRQMIHAGGGLFAASAIEKMMPIIEGLQKLERHWAVTKKYPGFPDGATTINPAYIQGGTNPAFIAGECHLWITVHFYPNESLEEVQKEIENQVQAVCASDPWLKEHQPMIRWGGRSMIEEQGEIFPPLELDEQHTAFQLLNNCHHQVTQKNPIVEMSPSVNDSGWFSYFGIPAISYGPGELTQAHSNDESVALADVLTFAKTMAAFIIQWCNQKREEE